MRHTLGFVVAMAGWAVFCCASPAFAGEPSADDEAAIRQAVASYCAAVNCGDAKAVADHWAEDGEYLTPDGHRIVGRERLEETFAKMFASGEAPQVAVADVRISMLTPEVAVEEGTATLVYAGGPPEQTTYVAIHVKKDDHWRLSRIRETALPSPPSHYEQLKDLAWIIGEWVDEDENSAVEFNCKWTKNNNFITRSFRASVDGQIEMEGTQVIGYDAAQGVIRSWLFDSDGGFAEGTWTRVGEAWSIRSTHTLPDGRKASSVNLLTPIDADTAAWESSGREVDGEMLPNIPAVKLVRRQAAEPQSEPDRSEGANP
jgi:uncharacterized protein (TIGR02246 family)